MTKQERNDDYFMKHAELAASMSYCKRSQVGAVIVKNERVIGEGRNGTLSGTENCCEDKDGNSKDTVVHAELNAIAFAAKYGIATDNCHLYVTLSPCIECSKAVIQAGITHVFYKDDYRISKGREFLERNGIKVTKI